MGRRKDSPLLAGMDAGILNLRRLWDKADAEDIEMGASYWQHIRRQLTSDNPDTSASVVLGVYSALSPNNSEASCARDTHNAIRQFYRGAWGELRVHTFPRNRDKAQRILLGEDPLDVLNGRKTRSFYLNMLNGEKDLWNVTVDSHMVNAWNNAKVQLDFAGISGKEYELIADGIRQVSLESGLVACQFQAVLWLTWRRIHRILYNPQRKLDLVEAAV